MYGTKGRQAWKCCSSSAVIAVVAVGWGVTWGLRSRRPLNVWWFVAWAPLWILGFPLVPVIHAVCIAVANWQRRRDEHLAAQIAQQLDRNPL